MRYVAMLFLLIFGAEAAQACSCFGPGGREQARGIAERAVAIAEVEWINPDVPWREGELLRPVRFHMGEPRPSFRIRPEPWPSTCHGHLPRDRPSLQVIYPDPGPEPEATETAGGISLAPTHPGPFHGMTDTCTRLFLSQHPGALAMVLEEARKLGKIVHPR